MLAVRTLLLASVALLAGCATTPRSPAAASSASQAVPAALERPAAIEKNPELARFYEAYDQAELAMLPQSKSYRGIKDADYGKWDEYTDAAALAAHNLDVSTLTAMRARFDRAALSPSDQLSYDLFEYDVARSASFYSYRENTYVFDQMNGVQSDVPAFLINIHRVVTLGDGKA